MTIQKFFGSALSKNSKVLSKKSLLFGSFSLLAYSFIFSFVFSFIFSLASCSIKRKVLIPSHASHSRDRKFVKSILRAKTPPKYLYGKKKSLVVYSLPRNCCHSAKNKKFFFSKQKMPYFSKEVYYSALDVMAFDSFRLLQGKKFALFTNATGKDKERRNSLDLLYKVGIPPQLIIEPEHGLYGDLDRESTRIFYREKRYNTKVLSLYSKQKVPSRQAFRGIDTIVIDIQVLDVRCYTYITTLSYLIEIAEKLQIEILVLDRPNPYSFWAMQGSLPNKRFTSFVSSAALPFLYIMSPAEYALYMKKIKYPRLLLGIVKYSAKNSKNKNPLLAHSWLNPSPNIPSFESALVYPGLVFFEGVSYSLGRGTTRPFIYSGAPWLNSEKVIRELKALNLEGVEISEINFRPHASYYASKLNHGLQIIPISSLYDSLQVGYEYMRIVYKGPS